MLARPTALRRAFDRRAARMTEANFLLRDVEDRMRDRLSYIKSTPARVLDLGCGPGQGLAALRARYPDARVCGLDWSAAMLREARRREQAGWFDRLLRKRPACDLVQADFRALPFASASFNLLWSNLALHWDPLPHATFLEWHRVTAAGGLLMFSLFGPDTLRELRRALADAGKSVHAPRFIDMHDLGDMLVQSRWSAPVMDMEPLTITYETPRALLADVRLLGSLTGFTDASGRALANPGLRTPRWRRALCDALDAQRNPDGLIPLTVEIIHGHAWKPTPSSASAVSAPGFATIPIEQIKRKPRA